MHVPGFEGVFENAVVYRNCSILAEDFYGFYALGVLQAERGRRLVAPHCDGEEIRRTIVVFGHYGDRYGFVAR